MQNIHHIIEINAAKEKIWSVLWDDKTFKQWASIIDEGTHMDGSLVEGGEVNFISLIPGYGVTSKVEKLIPYERVVFKQIADIKVDKDGLVEKRDDQWTGGVETYELKEVGGKVILFHTQDIPNELVEYFKDKIPQVLACIKSLAESSSNK